MEELSNKIISFRDERDWKQFHNPKDLAISLNLEAAELLEIFQWSGKDLEKPECKDKVEEELADIMNYCILMADAYDIDIEEAIEKKLKINEKKYPVEKAKGTSKKYTEFTD